MEIYRDFIGFIRDIMGIFGIFYGKAYVIFRSNLPLVFSQNEDMGEVMKEVNTKREDEGDEKYWEMVEEAVRQHKRALEEKTNDEGV